MELRDNTKKEGEQKTMKLKNKKGSKKQKLDKNKKPSKFREYYLKWKKWSEMEKEKKEFLKRNQNKSIKPKGYVARKIGVVSFWVLFGFMFLVVMVTFFSSDDKANADQKIEIKQNYATSPEAIQYAKNFVQDYFNWTISDEAIKGRNQTLEKYFVKGIFQSATMDLKQVGWNSSFKEAQLKKVEDKGENLAYITFLVKFELKRVPTPEQPENTETKELEKYFVVPIAYDGGTFGVYELPKFTYIYEDKTTIKEVATKGKLQKANVDIIQQIETFLPTFFKTYSEDEKDKLNYMLTNEKVTNGLNGTIHFDSIDKMEVFNGSKENHYIVFTQVIFVEPETGIPFKVNHQLELVKQGDRFVVDGMDNMTDKEVVSEGDKDKEVNVKAKPVDIEKAEVPEVDQSN